MVHIMKTQYHIAKKRGAFHLLFVASVLLVTSLACGLGAGESTATPIATPTATPIAIPPAFPPVTDAPTRVSTAEPSATPTPVLSSVTQQNPRRYRVEFVATVKNDGFALNELLIYQPRPIAWDGQQDITIEMVSPVPTKQGEDPVFGNGLYYWDIGREMPGIGESLAVEIEFTYTAYEITAKINPNKIQPYNTDSPLYELYTRPERFIESTDPQIVEIANQVALGEENPYLVAQKYYNYVVETAHYRLVGKGLLGAKALLTNDEGECGDFAALFIALCRAKGIPARSVVGYWAISGVEQTHVWAEFYIEGIGWIPVDPTIGQQSTSDKEYYFGSMDNQRVILHKGFNVPLDPPAPDNYLAPLLQGPCWWFWGDGDGDKMSLEVTRWNVTRAE
jgi:hypothetical protein